jgi:pimeloyl-ACP methyl ester carboxylesterase
MSDPIQPVPFEVSLELPCGARLALRGEETGAGPPLVLLHGLSATRRAVVHRSRHLVRRGYRLIAYDARGHGESDPAPSPAGYEYEELVRDLDAVIDHFRLERAVLVGSSMGAATAMAWTLEHPDRVPALVQITPAYAGAPGTDGLEDHQWQRSADVLESGGIDAFVAISQPDDMPERWREAAREATRQRLEPHRHLDAIAQALRVVPRSLAWVGMERLEEIEVPTLVVGSRDEADRLHPLEVATRYAERLPNAELLVEGEGEAPIAWQGARLSRAIGDFLERAGVPPQA